MPRSLHDLLAKVEHVNEETIAKLGRAATVEELSVRLRASEAEVVEALAAGRNRSPISLDAPPPGGDKEVAGEVLLGRLDDALELAEDRAALHDLLPTLAPREWEILRMRFVEDLPQTAIAERVGCSQMQVSRLLRRTLERLREAAEGAEGVAA